MLAARSRVGSRRPMAHYASGGNGAQISRRVGLEDMSTTPEEINAVMQSRDFAFCLIRRIAKTVAALLLENHDLKRQLQTLRDLKAARKQLRYEQRVYWKYDDAGNRVDGPFCPTCLDEDHVRPLTPGAINGLYRCVRHEALFASGLVGAVGN
jgi:hypothetical protein